MLQYFEYVALHAGTMSIYLSRDRGKIVSRLSRCLAQGIEIQTRSLKVDRLAWSRALDQGDCDVVGLSPRPPTYCLGHNLRRAFLIDKEKCPYDCHNASDATADVDLLVVFDMLFYLGDPFFHDKPFKYRRSLSPHYEGVSLMATS